MKFNTKRTSGGGARIDFDRPECAGFVEFDAAGNVVASKCEVKAPAHRPPMPMPDDFDPEQERRRMTQGGCCGQASE